MYYRTLYNTLKKHLAHKNYTLITGARQVGKTSLLKQLYHHLNKKGEETIFLNLEDKTLLASLNHSVKAVFNHVQFVPKKSIEGKSEKRLYLFIDEIQYLDDPTNFLKFLYDEYEYNVKIIATGSSAFYMDTKFTDSLAGRKRIFQLYPLSFNEFLIFKRQEKITEEITYGVREPSYISEYKTDIYTYLLEYLTYGGYPAVILENDKKEKKWLLEELKNSYLRKDIIESGVEKEAKFMMLIQLLADQTSQLVNRNELGNTLGIDNKTIDRYLFILEKSFHIDLLHPFHKNLRKELTKMPKVFFNDIGMRNVILGKFDNPMYRLDKGALLENFIYNQLRIKHNRFALKYWRTADGNEVDFIIEESYNTGYALEVKWDCKRYKPSKYKKFKAAYPNYPLNCIDSENLEILKY